MKEQLKTFQINIGRFSSLYLFANKMKRGRKVMTEIKKVNLKSHSSRKIFWVLVIQIASFLLANCMLIKFSEYVPEKGPWVSSSIISNVIVMVIFIIIYMCITRKTKKIKCSVDIQSKRVIKNGRKIKYRKVEYSQSITERMFKLCTLEFTNLTGTIIVKDVSVNALKYLK